jgi:hypothetical protein
LKREMKTIKVTGPNGSPVYATCQLDKHGYPRGAANEADFEFWPVRIAEYPTEIVPLDALCNIEINVGGIQFKQRRYAIQVDNRNIFALFFDGGKGPIDLFFGLME